MVLTSSIVPFQLLVRYFRLIQPRSSFQCGRLVASQFSTSASLNGCSAGAAAMRVLPCASSIWSLPVTDAPWNIVRDGGNIDPEGKFPGRPCGGGRNAA